MAPLDSLLAIAVELAEAAGDLLLREQSKVRTVVESKSTVTDMVTEMDRASERLIADGLAERRPDDAVLGEEGASRPGTTGVCWVIDPLDGTTNYLYGFPPFGVSIGVEVDGRAAVGVVRDPVHGETFTAVRGAGAFCNGRRLVVVGAPELATALVGTGFAYSPERRAEQGALLARVLPKVRDVRRAGAAAVDLCWVAAGRLDAFYERGLAPWDWCAGSLIAAEAGARTTRFADGLHLAAAPHLFDALADLVGAPSPVFE